MPRLIRRNPSYRKHKATGQAVATLSGRDFYLGPYGSKASKDEYDRCVREWNAAWKMLPVQENTLTIAELLLAFWKHAQTYYVCADGDRNYDLVPNDKRQQ